MSPFPNMFATLKTKFNLQRFFVGEGPLHSPYLLTHRRVYILPTRQGFSFALLLLIMLLGSINYSNSLGYFLTFLLASLIQVTIFHTYNNLLKLSFGPAICKPVFAGDDASFMVQVNNLNLNTRFSVNAFTPQQIPMMSDIKKNSISTITIKHIFANRGLISLPRFTIESRFPFGLFRAWAHIQFDQEQLVYPKPLSQGSLPYKSSGSSGGTKQLNFGTEDFKGLRSYIEGDPLQHLHWKNFSRHQILQTKEFSSAASDDLWLNYSDTTVTSVELKLSQLTLWTLLAEKENLNYGLHLPSVTINPANSKNHLQECLKQLALYTA